MQDARANGPPLAIYPSPVWLHRHHYHRRHRQAPSLRNLFGHYRTRATSIGHPYHPTRSRSFASQLPCASSSTSPINTSSCGLTDCECGTGCWESSLLEGGISAPHTLRPCVWTKDATVRMVRTWWNKTWCEESGTRSQTVTQVLDAVAQLCILERRPTRPWSGSPSFRIGHFPAPSLSTRPFAAAWKTPTPLFPLRRTNFRQSENSLCLLPFPSEHDLLTGEVRDQLPTGSPRMMTLRTCMCQRAPCCWARGGRNSYGLEQALGLHNTYASGKS